MKKRIAALFLLTGLMSAIAAEQVLYVAADGGDNGDGSKTRPFGSLQQARDAVRRMKLLPEGGVDVVFRGGQYPVSGTAGFGNHDSGSESSPVVYRAAEGEAVSFFGSTELNREWFNPLRKSSLKQRLIDPKAAAKIVVMDWEKHGITDYGKNVRHGWSLEPKDRVPPVGLSVGGERMVLARWPNRGEKSKYLRKEEAKFGVRNNIVVDCDKPVEHADYSGKHAYGPRMQKSWDACIQRFGNGKVKNTAHYKYDGFKVFLSFETEEEFRWPTSLAENNLFFNPTVKLHREARADKGVVNATGKLEHRNNWYTEKDPGFADWKRGDFRLTKSSPAFDQIPEFEPVDFRRMGRK